MRRVRPRRPAPAAALALAAALAPAAAPALTATLAHTGAPSRSAAPARSAAARFAAAPARSAAAPTPARAAFRTPARRPLYGVTVDDVTGAAGLAASLAALPERATVRVYFDVREPPAHYAPAVARLATAGDVLGELLDSSDERSITTAGLRARARAYLRTLGSSVAIWEIGNEVNGSWTGRPAVVAAKLTVAYDAVAARGGATALTLYANDFGPDHCGDGAGELTPIAFTRRYVPPAIARRLDYVLLSYYPDQCGGREPGRAAVAAHLRALHAAFPRAALGFGEVGLPAPATPATAGRAAQVMRWAYGLAPGLPYYVGGYFWWYGAQDALRPGAPLRAALAAAFSAESAALG